VGCGGLSGGGLRTMLLGAADPRIGCTVQVGYFTTSEDMILNVSYESGGREGRRADAATG
jgi:hypothetical protein